MPQSYAEDLRKILETQRTQLIELESAIEAVEEQGLAAENDRLNQQLQSLTAQQTILTQKVSDLSAESGRLKSTLNEHMLNERVGLLGYTRRNLDFYYKSGTSEIQNKISQLEAKYKVLLGDLEKSIDGDIAKSNVDLAVRLGEVTEHFNTTIKAIRAKQDKGDEALRRAYEKEIQERAGDELPSPEALEKRLRIFNFEMGFGTKAANILGLLLILLGVVFGLQYTYVHILRSDELRGAAAYFLGILFVIAGEVLIRKQKSWVHDADDYMSHWTNTAFPTGLAAGGVAILFASTAVSYFVLGILSIPAAIALCVGTSAVAFLLSIRYSSRTIACFALVGGYLPMTALEPG
ncbi:MAG: DUF2339 domain-containing protein, partial [Defluviitaleaceae bacterium]|nr:DUF2339 domain-containing protein [Defluviitaleaceae bacterium]